LVWFNADRIEREHGGPQNVQVMRGVLRSFAYVRVGAMQKLEPIRFSVMREMGLPQPPLRGAFSHGQLTLVEMDNGAGGVTFHRQPGEHCADFEARVIEDIRNLMGLASQSAAAPRRPSFESQQATQAAE
jgi:hypothetical protein